MNDSPNPTDDELEQQFAPEGEAQEEERVEPSPEAPAPPPGPRMVQVGNYTVPEEDLQSLVEFQNWAQSNPDKMEAFGKYLRGEAEFRVPEPEKKPEVDWELVDPSIKSIYDEQQKRLEELQGRLSQVEAPLSAIQQEQQNRVRVEANEALNAATGRMMERFKLNNDEIEDLAGDAAKLNIVPSLRAQGMGPQEALETALETAFWRGEKWRSRAIDEEISARTSGDRRSKASKISGTSGSDNGALDSQPRSEGERKAAMAAEIAEAMRGTA